MPVKSLEYRLLQELALTLLAGLLHLAFISFINRVVYHLFIIINAVLRHRRKQDQAVERAQTRKSHIGLS